MKVSQLPNGIKVATDGTPGHFVAAGIYVGTGSRFEFPGNAGSSHMIDRLAFKVSVGIFGRRSHKCTAAVTDRAGARSPPRTGRDRR